MLLIGLAVFAASLGVGGAEAQTQAQSRGYGYSAFGGDREPIHIRTFDGKDLYVTPRNNFAPDEATLVVHRIVSTTGLRPNFRLVEKPGINNAAAGIGDDRLRYIVYDPELMDRFEDDNGKHWGATSIFAHEIGHHLQGHTITGTGSAPPIELEADEFSGWAMQRLGATLEQAKRVMSEIASEDCVNEGSHPCKARRLAAIERGYNDARAGGRATDAPPPAPPPAPPEPAVLEPVYAVVARFIDGMKAHDVDAVRSAFAPDASIVLITKGANGGESRQPLALSAVLGDAANTANAFDERTIDRTGERSGDVARVLHYYNFYINGRRSHCGAEVYTLRQTEPRLAPGRGGSAGSVTGGWQIVSLEDLQVTNGCPTTP